MTSLFPARALAALAFLSAALPASAASLDGSALGLGWAIPFAGILLSIALMPLFLPHFWHANFGKVALFWALCCAVPLCLLIDFSTGINSIIHVLLADYVPFIIFVGSLFIVAGGITDIIAVDNLEKSEKFVNLTKCAISDYFDKRDFIARVRAGTAPKPEAIFHQGACSDTMELDGKYMMENNYRYTLELYRWAQELRIPFIYASSAATYGAHTEFIEDVRYEGPLNVYGYSKYLFDQVLRRELGYLRAPVIGLKYFNVYGPHEQHKGRMASVAFHQYFQYRRDHKVKLFEGCLGYANGAQERDFVYVEDVCKVLMHFLDRPVSGVFNCGTGRAQPFNAVSLSVVNTIRESEGLPAYTLEEAVGAGEIEYIPFPEALKGKYQAYTQANLEKLRAAGCDVEFRSVEEGTSDYMKVLLKEYPTVA